MITDIVKGHWNELFKKEEELSQSRLGICTTCPLLLKSSVGLICNKELTLNPNTNETDITVREGFYRGCNCRLEAKTRVIDARCPANKW